MLLRLALGALAVNKVQAPSLDLAVDEGASKSREDLFGLFVRRRLACD